MAINWTIVGAEIEHAVAGIVGAAWKNASAGASTQFAALIAAGQLIEQKRATMQQAEYDSLVLMQQRALEGVLQSYEAIALDVAEEAAAAAWAVVVGAIKSAYPALAFIP